MAETDDHPAFFTIEGEELIPSPTARGPWAPDMLHGRLVGGLAARALEAGHAEEGLHAARLTVDMFRNSPLVPLRVTTTRVRDGRRIRVADAEITSERGAVGRASLVLLRRGEQPTGEVLTTQAWDVLTPDLLGEPRGWRGQRQGSWRPPFDLWPIDGERGRRAWVRETHPLVAGEPVSPLVRTALAADFASPLSNAGTHGLQYINADYTLYLSRLPLGETVGLEATGHLGDEGVAIGQCTIHDESGPIGYCAVTAVANRGMGT
ncbi:acyl-CoA thioesterase domain-containing protein [Streptosporangium soli]|nr:thioesterase family protein [Streptosporangium sp. KLBMP 9127]